MQCYHSQFCAILQLILFVCYAMIVVCSADQYANYAALFHMRRGVHVYFPSQYAVLCYGMLSYTVYFVLRSVRQSCAELHYILLFCSVLYYIMLCCARLYCVMCVVSRVTSYYFSPYLSVDSYFSLYARITSHIPYLFSS